MGIQGEKRLEFDEDKENYHVMERRYGSFQRSLRVPDTVDEGKVEARFDNGVLKVTLPKRPEAEGAQHKIEIKKANSRRKRRPPFSGGLPKRLKRSRPSSPYRPCRHHEASAEFSASASQPPWPRW